MEAEASSRRPLLFGVVSMMARNRRKIPPRSPVKPVVRPVLPPFPAVIWSRIARP